LSPSSSEAKRLFCTFAGESSTVIEEAAVDVGENVVVLVLVDVVVVVVVVFVEVLRGREAEREVGTRGGALLVFVDAPSELVPCSAAAETGCCGAIPSSIVLIAAMCIVGYSFQFFLCFCIRFCLQPPTISEIYITFLYSKN
jgi:hypothetical protein